MKIIDAEQVQNNIQFTELIPLLKENFSKAFSMPQRQVHLLAPEDKSQHNAVALLPSWNDEVISNKMFTYFPDNTEKHDLPSLFSKIMLFSRNTGEPLALVDGTCITYWRTAAISALASQLLSRKNSEHLMLFGTGNLAAYLLHAHICVRDVKHITIWGRDKEKSQALVDQFSPLYPSIRFHCSEDVAKEISQADIICCATGSPVPLFKGESVTAGTHIDCLGNHLADARECDSATILKARVFVDSLTNTLNEAGELLIPIEEGVFQASDIIGELTDMCRQPEILRQSDDEITLFKSVGTAISDLTAAYLVYQKVGSSEQ